MHYAKEQICCFSGYRPEKMPFPADSAKACRQLEQALAQAIRRAAEAGCRVFLTGMSRGFDLWAARAVLSLRDELSLLLWCAVPYAGQDAYWEPEWRALYQEVLGAADDIFCLSDHYAQGCYHNRNHFLVEGASRMICYYDGQAGGTAYTVNLAYSKGLFIDNLADPQISLFLK